jgi:hypothetical protein
VGTAAGAPRAGRCTDGGIGRWQHLSSRKARAVVDQ